MLAKLNDKSPEVAELQRMLNTFFAKENPSLPPLVDDGDFGAKTEARVRSFQQAKQLKTDGIVGEQTWNALCEAVPPTKASMFPELNIRNYFLPPTKYFAQKTDKHFVTLHHTASGGNPKSVIDYWQQTTTKVATHFVIGGWPDATGDFDGQIWQAFSLDHWAWHLGCNNQIQNQLSVSIELCNWGFLELHGTKFYNYVGKEVPNHQVCALDKPFRGNHYYHAYTAKQIESAVKLCKALFHHYGWKVNEANRNMPVSFISQHALAIDLDRTDFTKTENQGALTSHTNFRVDKTDVYPHPELLKAFSGFGKK